MMQNRNSNPSKRRHICFLLPYFYSVMAPDEATPFAGGCEVQLSFIVRGLRAAGYEVTITCYARGQPDEFQLDGIRIVKIDRSGLELPIIRNIHPRLTSVWSALCRARADVYWQSEAAAITAVASLYCRTHGVPFMYSGASDPDFVPDQARKKFDRRGGWRDLKMYEWGLKRADAIIAQHAGQVASCLQWYGREAIEIPSCYVPPPGSEASPQGVVLWVAMMRSLKRPELFLELARRLPHLRFRIIGGPGPEKERGVYENMQAVAQQVPNLEFLGFVPFAEVEKHFNEARVFVNTSDYEGFPNTFLQSWARGVPTVSFFDCQARIDGRPVGFICHDLEDMKRTVARLCADDALWWQESERVRRYFQSRHTVDVAVERYSQLIEKMLLTRGRT